MSDIDAKHPIELDAPRFSIRKPAVRYDKQGDAPDGERLKAAMQSFLRDISRPVAAYMESCIHCGQCAQACHFYVATGDPKYTPIWKLEPFKQAYHREAGPFALFLSVPGVAPRRSHAGAPRGAARARRRAARTGKRR